MEPFALILAAMLAQTEASAPPPPPPPVTRPAPGDTNGDGSVTRQEWHAEFDRLDTDHDGVLTRAERRAGRPPRPRGDDDDGRPDRRGRGGDGPAAMMPAGMNRADYLARAAERFDRMDTNHDGRIDPAEMRAARPPR